MYQWPHFSSLQTAKALRILARNQRGTVLIEAAFALPVLVTMLFGILIYGTWFMTAHNLQQAANDAARAAVAGLNTTERRTLVDQSVTAARAAFPVPGAQNITVATTESGGYYRVTLRYDMTNAPLLAAVPLPAANRMLERSAVVRIST